MHYTVDSITYAVSIFDGINPEPFWYQPHYPDGGAFDSFEEATTWAELALASQTNESAPFPPNGKGQPGLPKPTAEEIRQAKLERLGLTVDDLKALLGIN